METLTLTRRKFLQFLGIGAAVAAVPATPLFNALAKAEPAGVPGCATGFRPDYQYGDYVVLGEDPRRLSWPELEELLNLLQEQITCIVPRRYWGNVRVWSDFNPSWNRWYLCWKYTPSSTALRLPRTARRLNWKPKP